MDDKKEEVFGVIIGEVKALNVFLICKLKVY